MNLGLISIRYLIAIICMLLFTCCDLIFDLVFSFEGSNVISFIFTISSALIVFMCTGKLVKDENNTYFKASKFIKANFDKVQVILSALDIICGIISIFAGFTLLLSFKIIKFVYVPTKILVILNKEKNIIKPIVKFSLLWVAGRHLELPKGEKMNFKKFLKANKWTIIIGFVLSAVLAYSAFVAIPTICPDIVLWGKILISILVFLVSYAAVFFLGVDTMKTLALREANKVLNQEKYDQLNNILDELAKKQAEEDEIEKLAVKAFAERQAQEKAQAAKTISQEEAIRQAEIEAKVQVRLNELLAQEKAKIIAEEQAKAQEQNNNSNL